MQKPLHRPLTQSQIQNRTIISDKSIFGIRHISIYAFFCSTKYFHISHTIFISVNWDLILLNVQSWITMTDDDIISISEHTKFHSILLYSFFLCIILSHNNTEVHLHSLEASQDLPNISLKKKKNVILPEKKPLNTFPNFRDQIVYNQIGLSDVHRLTIPWNPMKCYKDV